MVKKLELFSVYVYVSRAYANTFFEKTSRRTRQVAGGLGMGVGKEKDWARKDKVIPLKSWKIVEVLTKKGSN